MGAIITMTKTNLVKNPNTKTTYVEVEKETSTILEYEYNNIVDDKTVKWFRRLGGKETITKAYTCNGYCVVKLVSTSPDKQNKTVREFNFKWQD